MIGMHQDPERASPALCREVVGSRARGSRAGSPGRRELPRGAVLLAVSAMAVGAWSGSTCALAEAQVQEEVQVQGVRVWPGPERTRLVLDLSGPADFHNFRLSDPDRLVLDLEAAELRARLPAVSEADLFLARLRGARRNRRDLRIVLDLKRPAQSRVFVLRPNRRYGHRLVVDLHSETAATPPIAAPVPAKPAREGVRDVLIAVDAGHGGEDPGAIGLKGTLEKEVVLKVARLLTSRLDAEHGLRAYLVRRGDYYLSLKRRRELAREQSADLFISLHADAFRDRRVRGGTVYVLSGKGASSETARLLAQRENASDLIAGVKLEDKQDELLYKVLLDLSLTATREASYEAAEEVLGELVTTGPLHKDRVQWANFMVLRSPNIPSILIELGFISNPREERLLRDQRYRKRLAGTLFRGIKEYFRRRPPQGTLPARRRQEARAP